MRMKEREEGKEVEGRTKEVWRKWKKEGQSKGVRKEREKGESKAEQSGS